METDSKPDTVAHFLVGTLDKEDAKQLFERCATAKFTGLLELSEGGRKAAVAFIGGEPIDASDPDKLVAAWPRGNWRLAQRALDLHGQLAEGTEIDGALAATPPMDLVGLCEDGRLSANVRFTGPEGHVAEVRFSKGRMEGAELDGKPDMAALATVAGWTNARYHLSVRPQFAAPADAMTPTGSPPPASPAAKTGATSPPALPKPGLLGRPAGPPALPGAAKPLAKPPAKPAAAVAPSPSAVPVPPTAGEDSSWGADDDEAPTESSSVAPAAPASPATSPVAASTRPSLLGTKSLAGVGTTSLGKAGAPSLLKSPLGPLGSVRTPMAAGGAAKPPGAAGTASSSLFGKPRAEAKPPGVPGSPTAAVSPPTTASGSEAAEAAGSAGTTSSVGLSSSPGVTSGSLFSRGATPGPRPSPQSGSGTVKPALGGAGLLSGRGAAPSLAKPGGLLGKPGLNDKSEKAAPPPTPPSATATTPEADAEPPVTPQTANAAETDADSSSLTAFPPPAAGMSSRPPVGARSASDVPRLSSPPFGRPVTGDSARPSTPPFGRPTPGDALRPITPPFGKATVATPPAAPALAELPSSAAETEVASDEPAGASAPSAETPSSIESAVTRSLEPASDLRPTAADTSSAAGEHALGGALNPNAAAAAPVEKASEDDSGPSDPDWWDAALPPGGGLAADTSAEATEDATVEEVADDVLTSQPALTSTRSIRDADILSMESMPGRSNSPIQNFAIPPTPMSASSLSSSDEDSPFSDSRGDLPVRLPTPTPVQPFGIPERSSSAPTLPMPPVQVEPAIPPGFTTSSPVVSDGSGRRKLYIAGGILGVVAAGLLAVLLRPGKPADEVVVPTPPPVQRPIVAPPPPRPVVAATPIAPPAPIAPPKDDPESRLVAQAKKALVEGDKPAALLALKKLYALNPKNAAPGTYVPMVRGKTGLGQLMLDGKGQVKVNGHTFDAPRTLPLAAGPYTVEIAGRPQEIVVPKGGVQHVTASGASPAPTVAPAAGTPPAKAGSPTKLGPAVKAAPLKATPPAKAGKIVKGKKGKAKGKKRKR